MLISRRGTLKKEASVNKLNTSAFNAIQQWFTCRMASDKHHAALFNELLKLAKNKFKKFCLNTDMLDLLGWSLK